MIQECGPKGAESPRVAQFVREIVGRAGEGVDRVQVRPFRLRQQEGPDREVLVVPRRERQVALRVAGDCGGFHGFCVTSGRFPDTDTRTENRWETG
ncbi:MAG: hypothetical protein Fur0037_10680 [Planctomycetota bacterium]